MRIYDSEGDKGLSSILLLLTRAELLEMRGDIEQLLEHEDIDHTHVMGEDLFHEITIGRYGDGTESCYDPRMIELIEEDR